VAASTSCDSQLDCAAPLVCAAHRCVKAAASRGALPDLEPWPPPEPSSFARLPRTALVDAAHPATLKSVAARLAAALERAQYPDYTFFSVPGGFAMATRIERIDEQGVPLGELRFAPPNAFEPFALVACVKNLFFAPTGLYRQFLFVVTDQPFVASPKQLPPEELQTLPARGATALPSPYAERPFTDEHQVTALIYEFCKGCSTPTSKVEQVKRVDAHRHLAGAQLDLGARAP
jgi:hypothetical protein